MTPIQLDHLHYPSFPVCISLLRQQAVRAVTHMSVLLFRPIMLDNRQKVVPDFSGVRSVSDSLASEKSTLNTPNCAVSKHSTCFLHQCGRE